MQKKRILIFSPPFSGHLNVLKEMIAGLYSEYNFLTVITGWKNIKPDLSGLKSRVQLVRKSDLKETDPALWTLPRVVDSLSQCIQIAKEYKPDLIIYDFFSLEGYFVGRMLNIPYWCSIPAIIGPFVNKRYLKNKLALTVNKNAIKKLRNKFGVKINMRAIEMISDGLHLPGLHNLVWSYRSVVPRDFLKNRSSDPYFFVGNPRGERIIIQNRKRETTLIYFSLGTVVMNNLWNQQREARVRLARFIKRVAKFWDGKPIHVVFVSQGKRIFGKVPANWKIYPHVNQLKMLAWADVFITHGGGNSFNEAVRARVPMIVIPFFGDQPLVGQQVERLGIGINLVKNRSIDTRESKKFLNNDLANKLNRAVFKVLNTATYKKSYEKIIFDKVSIAALLSKKFKKY